MPRTKSQPVKIDCNGKFRPDPATIHNLDSFDIDVADGCLKQKKSLNLLDRYSAKKEEGSKRRLHRFVELVAIENT